MLDELFLLDTHGVFRGGGVLGVLRLVGFLCLLGALVLLIVIRSTPKGATSEQRTRASFLRLLFLVLLAVSALTIPRDLARSLFRQPSVVFNSENLTLLVQSNLDRYLLSGYYVLANPSDVPATARLWIPFEDAYWTDTSLEVNGTHSRRILRRKDGYLVEYAFGPREAIRIEVRGLRTIHYLGNGTRLVEYYLTSTRAWGRPIDIAEFRIVLPARCRLIDVFPDNFSLRTAGEHMYILIHQRDFSPERNLTLLFQPLGPRGVVQGGSVV